MSSREKCHQYSGVFLLQCIFWTFHILYKCCLVVGHTHHKHLWKLWNSIPSPRHRHGKWLVATVGGGEGRTNWERIIDVCTLSCIEQITGGKLLCNTGRPAWCSVMTLGGGTGEEREVQERRDIHIYIYDYDWFTLLHGRK